MRTLRAGSIVITVGDPAGVGPEITCRALADLDEAARAQVRIVGPIEVMERAAALVRPSREDSQARRLHPQEWQVSPVTVLLSLDTTSFVSESQRPMTQDDQKVRAFVVV